MGLEDAAIRVRSAIRETLDARDNTTPDLGGSGTTSSFTDALLKRL
jgi:isocitrate dehydrogenase (NAD+)